MLRRALRDVMFGGFGLGLAMCGGEPLDGTTVGGTGGTTQIQMGVGGSGGSVGSGGSGGNVGSGGSGGSSNTGGSTAQGGAGGTPPPGAAFEPRTCPPNQPWNPIPGLRPGTPVDYLAYPNGPQGAAVIESTGQVCATATNKPVCEEKVRAAFTGHGIQGRGAAIPEPRFLVATRRDEVLNITTVPDLVAFLRPVDTADEAALILKFDNYAIDCNTVERGGVRPAANGGFEVNTQVMRGDCETNKFVVRLQPDGTKSIVSEVIPPPNNGCAVGRAPCGLEPVASERETATWTLASFLGDATRLEAASVPAFALLARDLEALDAPVELVGAALEAAQDEIRHANLTTRLALDHGGRAPDDVRVQLTPAKTALALALENAVEGCVRETFGALVASFQAERATDPELAAAMSAIAVDEARHATLAHDLDAWLAPQLSPSERETVRSARDRAIADLARELSREHDSAVHEAAGWPRPAEALALHAALVRHLWGPSASA